ncbi:BMC domain-containing protein [Parendozoicomonas haliclonae]|uniref:Ethanolamine utilization protein EutK n=1 Tax=Parendozoicomonas haliclonae TaxID=1960125 RepID=A0A1X7AM67_9GAMM|nr:BMC domain-containing protein [Parendozoicomonas haliclonae]SMA48794.1 Ethanolamine utilization protein EutK precursor [Parendozoicomonas haliclonae]
MNKALGLLEFTSIAYGMDAADAMAKAADVRLEECKTICPGKFLVVVSGQVSAVKSAVDAGKLVGRQNVINELLIPSIHEEVFAGIHGVARKTERGAVGILEFFSVASAIEAADAAAKAAEVVMMEIRLAMGIGGKSYIVMTGELSSVKASVDAGAAAGGKGGMLIHKAVIASPTQAFFNKLS